MQYADTVSCSLLPLRTRPGRAVMLTYTYTLESSTGRACSIPARGYRYHALCQDSRHCRGMPRRVRQGSGGLGMREWTRPTPRMASPSMRSRGILALAAQLNHGQASPSLLQHSCHRLRALAPFLLVLSRRVGVHRLCGVFARTRNRALCMRGRCANAGLN